MWQRDNSDVANVTIEGTYTATGAIERSVDGGAFETAIASPTGGTFSDAFILSTGNHSIEYRMVDTPADTDTVNNIKVGDWWVLGPAQSNMSGESDETASIYALGQNQLPVSLFGNDDNFKEFEPRFNSNVNQVDAVSSDADGWGWMPFFASYYSFDNNPVPIGFIPCSKNGSGTGDWLKTSTDRVGGLNLYESALRRAQAVGGVRGFFLQTAEGDSSIETLKSVYKSNVLQFLSDMDTDLSNSHDMFIVPLHGVIGRDGNGTTTGAPAIRAAQIELAAENAAIYIAQETVTGIDISVGGTDDNGFNDGVHLQTYHSRHEFGRRIAESYREIFGQVEPTLTTGSFTYSQKLTGLAPTANKTNQLLMITQDHVDSTFWNNVSWHGGDIRLFKDENLATRYPVDLIKIDIVNQILAIETRVPSYLIADRDLHLFCGNTELVEPQHNSTFGKHAVHADELATLRMDSLLLADSSGNKRFGIPRGVEGALYIDDFLHPYANKWSVFPPNTISWIKINDSIDLLNGSAHSAFANVRVNSNSLGKGIVSNQIFTASANFLTMAVRSGVTPYYGGVQDGATFGGGGFGSDRALGIVDSISVNWDGTTIEDRLNGFNSLVSNTLTDGKISTASSLVVGSQKALDEDNNFEGRIGDVRVFNKFVDEESESLLIQSQSSPTFWTQSAPVKPASNTPPTASAGPDQSSISVGETVTLDGTGSSDADSDELTYSWSIKSAPVGSVATLSSTTVSQPTFTPDEIGAYEFSLIVNDGAESSAPDIMTLTATSANQEQQQPAQAGQQSTTIGNVMFQSAVNLAPAFDAQSAVIGENVNSKTAAVTANVDTKTAAITANVNTKAADLLAAIQARATETQALLDAESTEIQTATAAEVSAALATMQADIETAKDEILAQPKSPIASIQRGSATGNGAAITINEVNLDKATINVIHSSGFEAGGYGGSVTYAYLFSATEVRTGQGDASSNNSSVKGVVYWEVIEYV